MLLWLCHPASARIRAAHGIPDLPVDVGNSQLIIRGQEASSRTVEETAALLHCAEISRVGPVAHQRSPLTHQCVHLVLTRWFRLRVAQQCRSLVPTDHPKS